MKINCPSIQTAGPCAPTCFTSYTKAQFSETAHREIRNLLDVFGTFMISNSNEFSPPPHPLGKSIAFGSWAFWVSGSDKTDWEDIWMRMGRQSQGAERESG